MSRRCRHPRRPFKSPRRRPSALADRSWPPAFRDAPPTSMSPLGTPADRAVPLVPFEKDPDEPSQLEGAGRWSPHESPVGHRRQLISISVRETARGNEPMTVQEVSVPPDTIPWYGGPPKWLRDDLGRSWVDPNRSSAPLTPMRLPAKYRVPGGDLLGGHPPAFRKRSNDHQISVGQQGLSRG